MGKFDHLKAKPKITIDQFINDANSHFPIGMLKNKEKILLAVNGKLKRDACDKPINLYLKKDVKADIDLYCAGNKQAIINFLLQRAISDLREKNEFVLEDIS